MKTMTLVLGTMAVALGVTPAAAQSLESRADAERRQECRSAAALLEAGAPLAAADARSTLRAIRNCDVSGGPAIASAWANPSLRTDELPLLMIISWEIQDRRIMDGVIGIALDEGAAQELRYGWRGSSGELPGTTLPSKSRAVVPVPRSGVARDHR
jgi:hypothetical protein